MATITIAPDISPTTTPDNPSIQPAEDGYLLRVRALQELSAGEAVTVAYASLDMPTRARWRWCVAGG